MQIKVPVLEGTDSKALQVSAGHFEGTGSLGHGNYCIAGHNSTVYAEIFNDLDQIQIGDEMYLINNDEKRTRYTYVVTEYNIVAPQSVEVLDDYGDDRLTVISCTDDGKQRQVESSNHFQNHSLSACRSKNFTANETSLKFWYWNLRLVIFIGF